MTPEGLCPACRHWTFVNDLDITANGLIRSHWSQDQGVRRRAATPRPGKQYGTWPSECPGTSHAPKGDLRWPDGRVFDGYPYVPPEVIACHV